MQRQKKKSIQLLAGEKIIYIHSNLHLMTAADMVKGGVFIVLCQYTMIKTNHNNRLVGVQSTAKVTSAKVGRRWCS